ncbi:MAG: FkbM family methyltransferase [Saprospiraceae bacterium]
MQELMRRVRAKFYKWTERKLRIPIEPLVKTERLGSPYGGWIVPENWFDRHSICYLVGAGEDISFDLALVARYQSRAWIIDPTPRAENHFERWKNQTEIGQPGECSTCPGGHYPPFPADLIGQITFCPVGLWNEDTTLRFFAPRNEAYVSHSLVNLQRSEKHIEVPVKKLGTLMKELGHSRIDLLKIDVEGAEYQVLEAMLADNIEVDVLCIEYDETASNHLDGAYITRIEHSLQSLIQAGFRVIARESNCHNYTLVHQRRLRS